MATATKFPIAIKSTEGGLWFYRSDNDGDFYLDGKYAEPAQPSATLLVSAIRAKHWLWPAGSAEIIENATDPASESPR